MFVCVRCGFAHPSPLQILTKHNGGLDNEYQFAAERHQRTTGLLGTAGKCPPEGFRNWPAVKPYEAKAATEGTL